MSSTLTDRDHAPLGAACYPRLLGDIGGTHARWGMQLTLDGELSFVHVLPCAQHAGPLESIRAYVQAMGAPEPRSASIGIACPILGDEIRMINAHWVFSASGLQAALGLVSLKLMNDFTALALSLPVLQACDLRQVGGGTPRAQMAKGLVGAGTGLGVSGLLPVPHAGERAAAFAGHSAEAWVPVAGEGGHVTLAASNDREAVLLARLRQQFGHVSAERVLSGPGLVLLYQTHAYLLGLPERPCTPAQVLERGVSGQCQASQAAVSSFCDFMGTVAADLAVTLGTQGGLYIGGGIVPKLGAYFDQSGFRSRFENKGRYSAYLAAIPTFVIVHEFPGLVGAAQV